MKLIHRLGTALLLGLVMGCTSPPDFQSHRLMAMGTWVDVAWEGPAQVSGLYPQRLVEQELRRFEQQYYPWADGELAALNAAISRGEPFELSAELEQLLVMGKQFYMQSNGRFDPGVGALVAAWGFGNSPEPQPVLADVLRAASINQLTIDGQVANSSSTALVLDLGGYAKGYAVDRSLTLLAELGIANAIVNAGGDLRVMGQREGGHWQIGIQHPRQDGELIGSIWLAPGEAAFTSGDYARTQMADGVRRHHLIDPDTGTPANHTQAVTVITDNGAHADASATAIFVAGPDHWQTVADQMGVDRVLRVDGSGQVQLTAAMAERLETRPDLQTHTIMPRAH